MDYLEKLQSQDDILQCRIQDLRKKKKNLERKLRTLEEEEIRKRSQMEEVMPRDYKDAVSRKKALENLLDDYRLLGVSLYTVEDPNNIICFDTMHKGKFFESYYVEIKQTNEALIIAKHTLPCFIPILKIADTYLNKNMKEFVHLVNHNIHAYIVRREELNIVKEHHKEKIKGEPQSSLPVDYVDLTIAETDRYSSIRFIISHPSLLATLPHDVRIIPGADLQELKEPRRRLSEEIMQEWRDYITTLPLSEAMDLVLDGFVS
ncbi:hypothetical protein CHS0354_015270 [Potamilus streckersoni]|uniref:Centromere protein O n=1 Tax=Potamilus streckersoni TaxID=2493646 RepID=A0AAE0VKA4_9BIVA|nr:hypothetical protein CHS0354_015270 [Potamilus streckersoni]